MNDYEAKTYYRKLEIASNYEKQYRGPLSISNVRPRLVGWAEQGAFLRILQQLSGVQSVLDIACGTGRYLEILLDQGFHVGGMDISLEMLSFARYRTQGRENLLFIQQGDAEKLPFEDHQFDLVTCMRLYHRIPAGIRRRMLSELKRVGRDKAILFFGMSTPWLGVRHALRSKLIPGRPSNPFPLRLEQLHNELAILGMQFRTAAWVLPFLAEGLVVYVTW